MLVELLYRFQEMAMREQELKQLIKALPQFKELKQIKEKFTANQKRLKEKRLNQQDISRKLKKAEGQVTVLERKQKELETLLYGGTLTNHKEMESIEQKIQASTGQISDLSDDIIKTMEENEELDKEISLIEKELQMQYQEFNQLKLTYNRLKINLEQELAAVMQDKEKVFSLIDEKSLEWYQEKRDHFSGTPIGKIMENHACSGCRTVVPLVIIKEAKANPGNVFCENCGRMLYAPVIS